MKHSKQQRNIFFSFSGTGPRKMTFTGPIPFAEGPVPLFWDQSTGNRFICSPYIYEPNSNRKSKYMGRGFEIKTMYVLKIILFYCFSNL